MHRNEDNLILTRQFEEVEVRDVVWECESSNSPGRDDVNLWLIKYFWDVNKDDCFIFISEFHLNGRLVRGAINAFISLSPKIENPTNLSDFMPIFLIWCMYKVLSKILANRLKKVIPKVILDSQYAFVEGRQMVDDILIQNEFVDNAKRRKIRSATI